MENAFKELRCPCCQSSIQLTLRTVCIATSIGIECLNKNCGYLYHGEQPSVTNIHGELKDSYERSLDYAINVLYVLGFNAVGDGCTDAARILGLLGLPNDTTMESRSFTITKDWLVPLIFKVCNDILQQNLMEEVQLSMEA